MPTLTEKLSASAHARLRLPAGRLPCEEPDRFRRFLKIETQRLRILHRAGGGGREVCRARAEMIDLLLQHTFDAYRAALASDFPPEPLAVVALGGYGRAELNPHSDLDIAVLHDRRTHEPGPFVRALMEKFVPFLWTVGLECHPVVRNLDDCVREANRRMDSRTALVEARQVWGDRRLFAQMRIVLEDRCLKGREEAYVEERLKDQQERRAKWGHSYCLLEPNVKSGCGGLRDYQNLRWMAAVRFHVADLGDLVGRKLLDRATWRQLERSYDFLLRVRNELHHQQSRKNDILTRALQPSVAHHLGYHDRSLARRVERFMGDYYREVRHLHLITRNLERRLALRKPGRLARLGRIIQRATPFREPVFDGLRAHDGELVASSSRIFRDQPRRLIRAFLHAQQLGLPFHPDLEDAIRRHLSLVNREFLADPRVHQTFLEILNRRGDVARILRAMHETGFLAKYMPAFHRLTCRVQHEFYHLYTADEHTLVCLEVLDRIWDAREQPFAAYTEMFRALDRPYILYLALLLHDVGKASHTRDHAAESTRVALTQTRRLRLPAPASATVAFLVRHHLLMARLSQKFDLDDPEVIRDFASSVQTPEHLHLLTLHTFADSMATSESLWTPFKESLLWTLHRRAEGVLAGDDHFRGAAHERLKSLRAEVRRQLPRTIQADEIESHFSHLPERYFLVHSAREIAGDISLAHRFMWNQLAPDGRVLDPVIAWHAEPDRGYSVLKICTWDRPRLFNRVAGALAASALNILGARIFSRPDGPVFDTLFVTDPQTARVPAREARECFDDLLTRSLRGEPLDFPRLIAQHRNHAAPPLFAGFEPIPARIAFDNTTVRDRTVIEIEGPDRIGLLFDLTDALADLGLDITFARISTEKGAAIDTFYVTEDEGTPVTRAERRRDIEHRLRTTLQQPLTPTPESAAPPPPGTRRTR
ncbi:MAG: [protein-PII] uridylyltransferase [Verrucomicrobiae bacterium]|nr:[protein-PII] uridylyltransferase [Verrucomicrobiae bacterium]